jgi:nucleotide-binding universal stress UspA family protein
MFQKILVALQDDSASSRHVFDEAVSLAKATNACLLLLHVLSPVDESYPTPLYPSMNGIYPTLYVEAIDNYSQKWKTYEQQGLQFLRSLADQAATAGVSVEFSQSIGDPGRSICTLARTWEADLIMMGRRGLSGISEFLLGSVSNYVVHHASCSVLTVQQSVAKAPEVVQDSQLADV